MDAFLNFFSNAPLPAILIVVGALFLFFAIGGSLSDTLRVESVNPRRAMIIGVLFVVAGVGIELWRPQLGGERAQSPKSVTQKFIETMVEPAPPPSLRDSSKTRLESMIRDALRHKAEVFLRAMLGPEQLKELGGEAMFLDDIGDSPFKFGAFEIRTISLANGDPGVEAYGEAWLNVEDIKRKFADLRARQPIMRELAALRKQTKELSNQLQVIEAKYRDLRETTGNASADADMASEKKKLEEKASQLAAQLDTSELYREALVRQALGRQEGIGELLDKIIARAPFHIQARLMRNTPEDRAYLIQHAPKASLGPFLNEARDAWQRNRKDEARTILRKAKAAFERFSVFEVTFIYDRTKIPFKRILESITLEATSGRWRQPPFAIPRVALFGDDRVLIWNEDGEALRLRFGRFGFEEAVIDIPLHDQVGGTIPAYTMAIKQDQVIRATNTVRGRVKLSGGASDSSGIRVSIFDSHGRNRGFKKTAVTDHDGEFAIDAVPRGEFELQFVKPNYVVYSLTVDVQERDLRCWIDAQHHYDADGISPCDLRDVGLRLHPIRTIKIKWTLQENPDATDFRTGVSEGDVKLKSALADDWYRGGWHCCKSSFNFGSRTIDAKDVDIVVFTETDGTIYFDQPHDPFIAILETDYESLKEVPEGLRFRTLAPVRVGETYVLKTGPTLKAPNTRFIVKMKVVSITPGAP